MQMLSDPPSMEDLRRQEEEVEREEYQELERKRRAASQLAMQRGLSHDSLADAQMRQIDGDAHDVDADELSAVDEPEEPTEVIEPIIDTEEDEEDVSEVFIPARLPHFR
jgi:hypothetical protein